ncbi:hypothetical protein [Burkholderia gladioli]|uniref:hypothetical protein n=1 Tax=Burkholderia gladioli TaxID=28095 RepID=UPI00163FF651|nr:hypothetical protein [Burkholderia gladioli]
MNKLRCRPGDLARVIYAKNPALIGRICLVERMHDCSVGRWEVKLLGMPAFGITQNTNCPVVTNDFLCRDVSLLPLRGDGDEFEIETREVDHA